MKKVIVKLHLFMLVTMLMLCFVTPVFASDLDSLNSGSGSAGNSSGSDRDAVSDYIKGYTPITDKNMASASQYATPLVNLIGTATGAIVMLVGAGIVFITGLDLVYIGIPPLRSVLNPVQPQGDGASPMGGMGMGMRGMGMRGMGMSPMGGGTQPQQETGLRRKWVSDEAIFCVSQASMQAQPQGGMASPMGGMGMGGMGMSPMGGGVQPQQASTKSAISMYLRKRLFFIVVFAIALIVLTSSILMDCGINLASLSIKIIGKFNEMVGGVQI